MKMLMTETYLGMIVVDSSVVVTISTRRQMALRSSLLTVMIFTKRIVASQTNIFLPETSGHEELK